MPATAAKAYSYLRFSTPEQSEGDSFRRQTQMAVTYAAANGLTLDTELTFQDLGVSAYRGKNAEAGRLSEFLEAVRCGLVPRGSTLLVENLDRISRATARKALRVLESIVEEHITVVTLSDGRVYTAEGLDGNPIDLLVSILTFMRANEESEQKSRRVKESWAARRALGAAYKNAKMAPLWITLDKAKDAWVVDKAKAKVVLRVFKEYLEGVGCDTIARHLNEDCVPVFGASSMWRRMDISNIVKNPACIGTYVPTVMEHVDGKTTRKALEPIPNYLPAIVPEDTWRKAQASRTGTAAPRACSVGLQNLFAGLLRCAACGSALHSQSRSLVHGQPYRYLVCARARYGAGCVYKRVRYERLESAFLTNVDHFFAEAPHSGAAGEALDKELQEHRATYGATLETIRTLGESLKLRPSSTLGALLQEAEGEKLRLEERMREIMAQYQVVSTPLVDKRLAELKGALREPRIDYAAANVLMRSVFSSVVVQAAEGVAEFVWRHGGETKVVFAFSAA